jgi:hypothetical protein
MRHRHIRTISVALFALGLLSLSGPQGAHAFEAMYKLRLASADLDGDGTVEILAAGRLGPFRPLTGPLGSRRARVEAYSRSGTLLHLLAACEDIHVADDIAGADLDADGRDEVLVIGAGRLSVLSLQGGRLLVRHVAHLPLEWTHRVDAADVDGDGLVEVAVAAYDIGADGGIGNTALTIYRWTGSGLHALDEIAVRGHVGDLTFSLPTGSVSPQLILERGAGEEGGDGIGYAFSGTGFVEAWQAPLARRPIRIFHLSGLPGSDQLSAGAADGSATYLRTGRNGPSIVRSERMGTPAAPRLLAPGPTGPLLVTARPERLGARPALTVTPVLP